MEEKKSKGTCYLVFAKQSSKAVIHHFKINCKLMRCGNDFVSAHSFASLA